MADEAPVFASMVSKGRHWFELVFGSLFTGLAIAWMYGFWVMGEDQKWAAALGLLFVAAGSYIICRGLSGIKHGHGIALYSDNVLVRSVDGWSTRVVERSIQLQDIVRVESVSGKGGTTYFIVSREERKIAIPYIENAQEFVRRLREAIGEEPPSRTDRARARGRLYWFLGLVILMNIVAYVVIVTFIFDR